MEIANQQTYQKEVKEGTVKKPVRSKAGVTVLTVVLKPRKCNHGTCVYCPGGETTPQSYTDKSPAIMRAMAFDYDIVKQVSARLDALVKMNHPTDKIEVIILGGTFLQYEKEYQEYVIKSTYDVLNGDYAYASRDTEKRVRSKTLEAAKKLNEKAQHRVVALCIENRPDNCSEEEIKQMLRFGTTRVEIGIQMPDNEIYKNINRGHTLQDVIEASKRLKDAGFKVGYHIMPGLPGSDPKKDIKLFKMIFDDERFRPDQLKIYPCQIVAGAPLEKIAKVSGYKPYDEKTTKKVVEEMMKLIPEYCRIMRIMREIPKELVVQGIEKLDLRKDIEDDLKKDNIHLREIRMREVGFQKILGKNIKLKIIEYDSSGGKELFLEIVDDKDILYGLLRLRFPSKNGNFIHELKDCAIVRELHVYGQALELEKIKNDFAKPSTFPQLATSHTSTSLPLTTKSLALSPPDSKKNKNETAISHENVAQHQGLGKQLMKEAEEISSKNGFKKIAVISGVGVREYYKKMGYELDGEYMVKKLS
ncbi:tRNA uridine(34) 5-carboxymethylaminomethyl modification radical SAM/GNAT enzyme Elp3 [Candidatus Pacearchaeota archaeon CG10_big_fil_rev_8_21_14_0_10_32_14]|nr:MAG: tRNA uridine(34) 5-carboxymethylaminomethyl modification radical SAM/GNAT enzyme Elp3 [Candidatus Pacearchaeota archaeon CG10_big_fil_rev_8_21_14_0_10_32_14]